MCNDTARIQTTFFCARHCKATSSLQQPHRFYSYINVRVNAHITTRLMHVCKHACDGVSACSVVPWASRLRNHVAAWGSACGAGLEPAPARFRACTELSGLAAELAACAPRTELQAAQARYRHALHYGGRATGSLPHTKSLQEAINSCCSHVAESQHARTLAVIAHRITINTHAYLCTLVFVRKRAQNYADACLHVVADQCMPPAVVHTKAPVATPPDQVFTVSSPAF